MREFLGKENSPGIKRGQKEYDKTSSMGQHTYAIVHCIIVPPPQKKVGQM